MGVPAGHTARDLGHGGEGGDGDDGGDGGDWDHGEHEDGDGEARRAVFRHSRAGAILKLLLGWLCAQGLLTLIPIAPGPLATFFLLVIASPFVLMALSGLRSLIVPGPYLTVSGMGVRFGSRPPIEWEFVRGFRYSQGRRTSLELWLDEAPAASMPWRLQIRRLLGIGGGYATLRLSPGVIDGSLAGVAEALRAERPDLEITQEWGP